jgi:hypothetical protein
MGMLVISAFDDYIINAQERRLVNERGVGTWQGRGKK